MIGEGTGGKVGVGEGRGGELVRIPLAKILGPPLVNSTGDQSFVILLTYFFL
jgi:hypothetical protein